MKVHVFILCEALKPNWQSLVDRRGFILSKLKYSKNLDINDAITFGLQLQEFEILL